jgi:hypothetical protein
VKKAYDDIRASKFDPMRYEYNKKAMGLLAAFGMPTDSQ